MTICPACRVHFFYRSDLPEPTIVDVHTTEEFTCLQPDSAHDLCTGPADWCIPRHKLVQMSGMSAGSVSVCQPLKVSWSSEIDVVVQHDGIVWVRSGALVVRIMPYAPANVREEEGTK